MDEQKIEIADDRRRQAWNKAVRRQLQAQDKYDRKLIPLREKRAGLQHILDNADALRAQRVAEAQDQVQEVMEDIGILQKDHAVLEKKIEKKKALLLKHQHELGEMEMERQSLERTHGKLHEVLKQAENGVIYAEDVPVLTPEQEQELKTVDNAIVTAEGQATGPLRARTKDVDKLRHRFGLPDGFLEEVPDPIEEETVDESAA